MGLPRFVAGAHATYLLVSGLWPVVHRKSFEAVTGPKQDFWLARTVGGLAVAMGGALALAVRRGRAEPEAKALALGGAAVFVVADLWAARSESRTYLADLAAQLAFASAWLVPWRRPTEEYMEDATIRDRIERLVAEEHDLWESEAGGSATIEDRRRLDELGVRLDQLWDLLRQRRALARAGKDPEGAQLRDPSTIETYEQ